MRLRGFLVLFAIAVLVEAATLVWWTDSNAFDCYPHCDAGQQISGWILTIVPLVVAAILIVSLARWLWEHRPGDRRTSQAS